MKILINIIAIISLMPLTAACSKQTELQKLAKEPYLIQAIAPGWVYGAKDHKIVITEITPTDKVYPNNEYYSGSTKPETIQATHRIKYDKYTYMPSGRGYQQIGFWQDVVIDQQKKKVRSLSYEKVELTENYGIRTRQF